MERLELKHLAGYLPYELKMQHRTEFAKHGDENILRPWITKLKPLFLPSVESAYEWIPILRPLSDLTKEIDVNGKKFVPMEVLNNMLFTKHSKLEYYDSEFCNGAILFSTNISGFNILSMNEKVQKLYEWHFDLHNLIGKNLAIDINSIK